MVICGGTICYEDTAYCCFDDDDMETCCYSDYYYQTWWFWFIWVMLLMILVSCFVGCFRACRRRSHARYVILGEPGSAPGYGSVVVTSNVHSSAVMPHPTGPVAPPPYSHMTYPHEKPPAYTTMPPNAVAQP